MKTDKPNERFLGFLLFLTVTLLLLVFAEFIIRMVQENPEIRSHPRSGNWAIIPERTWIEYHPVLGWFHKRNASTVLGKNERMIPVTTNSSGLRGPREYPLDQESAVFRLVTVGDSFTFGFGVKDDETFSRDFEQVEPGWEVLNFGFLGYGIDQMHLFLEECVFPYKPM